MTTAALIGKLCSNDEAPWLAYNSKKADQRITSRQLAKLLDPYEITSINNIGRDRLKGYSMAAFQDAFSRYIPSTTLLTDPPPAITAQHDNDSASNEIKGSDSTRSQALQSLSAQQKSVADSGCSASERIDEAMHETIKEAPRPTRADGADSSMIVGACEYTEA